MAKLSAELVSLSIAVVDVDVLIFNYLLDLLYMVFDSPRRFSFSLDAFSEKHGFSFPNDRGNAFVCAPF